MEHLWSRADATGGNRWQMGRPRKPLKQADPQPVATHGNRFGAHGKEGVNGSSPLEGFHFPPVQPPFLLPVLTGVFRLAVRAASTNVREVMPPHVGAEASTYAEPSARRRSYGRDPGRR
jgi:hypothetical protein